MMKVAWLGGGPSRPKSVRGRGDLPPFPSTYCASPRQRFEYSVGVDPNSELWGLSSL